MFLLSLLDIYYFSFLLLDKFVTFQSKSSDTRITHRLRLCAHPQVTSGNHSIAPSSCWHLLAVCLFCSHQWAERLPQPIAFIEGQAGPWIIRIFQKIT